MIIALIVAYMIWGDFLSFESIKLHQASLRSFARQHYGLSVAIFISVLISTAFFVPGALAISLLGGFLFGTVPGVLYIDTGMTLGAALSFLSARYVFGNRLQKKFAPQFKRLNEEIKKHGPNYLVVLRIVPLMPFFAVNYLAAMTKMPLLRFVLSTMIGILPGALACAYAGEQLSSIQSLKGLMSPPMVLAIIAIAVLTLLPVILSHSKRVMKNGGASRIIRLFRQRR